MPPSPARNGVHRPANHRSRPSPSLTGAKRRPPSASPPSDTGSNGHDQEGRFAEGNRCAVGNPFARRLAAHRSRLLDAVSDDDVRAVVAVMLENAKAGDVAAARLILTYVVGKPTPVADPDAVDLDEFRLFRQPAEATAILTYAASALPPDMAVRLVHAFRPHLANVTLDALHDQLTAPDAADLEEIARD
jgi:hypothetical protein